MTVVSGYIKSMCVQHRGAVVKRENAPSLCNSYLITSCFTSFVWACWLQPVLSGWSWARGHFPGLLSISGNPVCVLVCATLCVILADEVESVTRIVVPYILLLLCSSEGIKSHYLSQPHLFSNSWRTDVPTGLD